MRLKRHIDFINESFELTDEMKAMKEEISKLVDVKQFQQLSSDSFTVKHAGGKKEQKLLKLIEKYFELNDFDVFHTDDEFLGKVWVYDFFFSPKNNAIRDFLFKKLKDVLPNMELIEPEEVRSLDEYELKSNGKRVATWRYSSPTEVEIEGKIEGKQDVESGKYLLCGTIVVEEEFRRKGVYTAIIYAGYYYAKGKGLKGLASFNYDLDSGEFERTAEATAVWEKLLKNDAKVAKVTSDKWGDGPETDYLMN